MHTAISVHFASMYIRSDAIEFAVTLVNYYWKNKIVVVTIGLNYGDKKTNKHV